MTFDDRDAGLDDVKRWFYGGTEPPDMAQVPFPSQPAPLPSRPEPPCRPCPTGATGAG